ncbi:BrnA antitoxin family protein [Planctomycetota bacterium]
MKNTRKKIPLFKNEDQEREFWSKNSPLDFMDINSVEQGIFPNLKPTMKSISIRLPEHMLEQLKILAHKRDIPYQSLVKLFLGREILMERRALESS